jgi:glutathione S-transferase
MADYILYCNAQSGNSYKVALMLELARLDWSPRLVEFFQGETRTPQYREKINEMGEIPVLEQRGKRLTQSGAILDYLAEQTRKFGPKSEDERREIWRWILFDNHKFTSYLATLRFMLSFAKTGETEVTDFLRTRATNALKIADLHFAQAPFVIGKRATIADFSMCGYLFYGEELGVPLDPYTNLLNWLDRIKSLPGWKGPYDLMPRATV